MKVKIKGLVFVGFAAAVFAQSAMATISANENDKKIVASKYYVDSSFQDKTDRVTATPTGNDASTIWASTDKYPSMAVLKDVKDTLTAINVTEGSTGYVDVAEDPTGTFTVDLVPGQVTSSVGASNTSSTKLVTEGAVANYAEAKANKLEYDTTAGSETETITAAVNAQSNNTSNTTFPTTKNVYEFVKAENAAYQPKDDTQATASAVRVSYNSNGSTPGWGSLAGAQNGYVAISGSGANYTVDIPAAQIATHGATVTGDNGYNNQITSGAATLATAGAVYEYVQDHIVATGEDTIGSNSGKINDTGVPTMKNVYDFVTATAGNYQPVVPDAKANSFVVGYKSRSGTEGSYTYGEPEWRTLTGDGSYVTVSLNGDTNDARVALTGIAQTSHLYNPYAEGHGVVIADNIRDIFLHADYDDLEEEYVTTITGGTGQDNVLPSAQNVFEFVMGQTGGNVIPEMPVECTTAATNGGYCALVYGAKTGGGNALQWTVMAPAPASGNGGGNNG